MEKSYKRPANGLPSRPASRQRQEKGFKHRDHGRDPPRRERDLSPRRERAPARPATLISAILRVNSPTFEMIQQVGDGTYGKVYKARNQRTNEIVALKRLKLEAEREGLPITAVREIKLLESLRHETIVNLTEMVISGKDTFMAFEYVENDLAGLLLNPALIITPSHIKSLFKQMMEGLSYLHKNAVVHRDIKGSNILLDNKGNIKLADFGLARTVDLHDLEAHYTNRVITLWYRPPELLLGETQYSTEVDIWSMGCLFAELFVRKALFPGKDEVGELEEIYKVLGTPTLADWPQLKNLPWYHLVQPPQYPGHFDKLFTGVTRECYDLASQMLQMNPRKRVSAPQVLRHRYFLEDPPAKPLRLEGEWHDFDAKQAAKKTGSQAQPNLREDPNGGASSSVGISTGNGAGAGTAGTTAPNTAPGLKEVRKESAL